MYEDLDGESEYEGTLVSNKIIFISILNAVCYANFDKVVFSGVTFRIGTDISNVEYLVDSNLRESKDKIPDQILLKQEYKVPYDGRTFYMHDYKEYYDPMEMVTIITYDEQYNEVPMLVCAMYIKSIADQEEWKRIMFYVRIGFDIIIAATAIATLVTGPQFLLFAISVIDLGLATKDIQMAVDESELLKTEEGRQYVETWNKIYMIGGIVTAGPLLLRTALNLGAKLLETLTVANARNFVVSLMIRILAQKNITFGKYTIEFIEDADKVFKITNYILPLKPISRLYEAGALIFSGLNSLGKDDILFVFYKDDIILYGTAKKVREDLKEILNATTKAKAIRLLDELYDLVHISDDALIHSNIGDFAGVANPKKSLEPGKMLGGGHGQANIIKLNQLKREYEIVHEYKNGVRIGSVSKIADKTKKTTPNTKITGQSWFPINWDEQKILQAGKSIINYNLKTFKNVSDGVPIFDNFDGVRVGVLKTDGKPATIFPDNAMQPMPNSTRFEINPIKK